MFKLTFVVLLSLVACGKKDEKPGGTSASSGSAAAAPTASKPGGDCIVGTYEKEDVGKMKTFTFNADKTGIDVPEPGKPGSKFTWSLKDEHTVHISYPKEGDSMGGEFDMQFNCENETFDMLFKKKK